MTIETTAQTVTYDGNDSVTTFNYSWKILSTDDIKVVLIDANGTNTDVSSSEYSVSGVGEASGGSITYPLVGSPLATGMKLAIVPDSLLKQQTSISNQKTYYPNVVENMVDKVTLQVQKLFDSISRAIIVPIGSAVSSPEELINSINEAVSDCQDYTTESEGYRDECEDFRDDIQDKYIPYGEDESKVADTIAVTLSAPISSYVDGQEFKVKVANTNTGATTINIDGVGAITVEYAGLALIANQLIAGRIYKFVYNNSKMELNGALDVVDDLTIEDLTVTDSEIENLQVNKKFNTQANSATISSGAVTYSGFYMVLDTEGASASDDLDTINGGTEGDYVLIRQVNSARDITITHNIGNIVLYPEYKAQFTDVFDNILLYNNGTHWTEISRSVQKDFLSSKATNGYTRLPNGLIRQWGYYAGGSSTPTITLPITYPNANLNTIVSSAHNDPGNSPISIVRSISASNFAVFSKNAANNSLQAWEFYWESIGY